MESAVFAYNVGIANFLSIVESLLGAAIVHWSGMTTVEDHCDFQALPKLIVVLQIIIPLVVGIPAVLLNNPFTMIPTLLFDGVNCAFTTTFATSFTLISHSHHTLNLGCMLYIF
jgi:hypothetical protein